MLGKRENRAVSSYRKRWPRLFPVDEPHFLYASERRVGPSCRRRQDRVPALDQSRCAAAHVPWRSAARTTATRSGALSVGDENGFAPTSSTRLRFPGPGNPPSGDPACFDTAVALVAQQRRRSSPARGIVEPLVAGRGRMQLRGSARAWPGFGAA